MKNCLLLVLVDTVTFPVDKLVVCREYYNKVAYMTCVDVFFSKLLSTHTRGL